MSHQRMLGIAETPMLVVLSVILGAIALSLGMDWLDLSEGLINEQRSIRSFDKFVELCVEASYGGIGGEKKVRLQLPSGKIHIEGKLATLEIGGETKKVEVLPIPLKWRLKENFVLKDGSFIIKLECLLSDIGNSGSSKLILRIREVK